MQRKYQQHLQWCNEQKNEIIIRNIPIDYTENDVKRQFLIYGNILKVIIKVLGTWKQAHVFFKDAKTVKDNFIDNWLDFIEKDGVRIYLADNYENNMNQRSQFCSKLCNLPKNTTAYDLEGYIRLVNGKTCFIPRARKIYNRLRYAYVNFESQEDLERFSMTLYLYTSRIFKFIGSNLKPKHATFVNQILT